MTINPPHTPPSAAAASPCRGTIIVDTSALFRLSAHISPTCWNPQRTQPDSYLHLLSFLAEHGYRILIPETVALEVGLITADGEDLFHNLLYRSLFRDRKKEIPNDREQKILAKYAGGETASKFLKNIAVSKDWPNPSGGEMRIVADTGPAEADIYCARIKEAANKIKKNPHLNKTHLPNQERRASEYFVTALGHINSETEKQHLGDKAVISLFTKELNKSDKNILLLSDDLGLNYNISKACADAVYLNARHFVFAFAAAGLGSIAGFNNTATPATLTDDMTLHNPVNKIKSLISPANPANFERNIAQNPFYHSLQALKKDLEEKAKSDAQSAKVERPGGIKPFEERYAGLKIRPRPPQSDLKPSR